MHAIISVVDSSLVWIGRGCDNSVLSLLNQAEIGLVAKAGGSHYSFPDYLEIILEGTL